jgi:hypothetical protein
LTFSLLFLLDPYALLRRMIRRKETSTHEYFTVESRMLRLIVSHPDSAVAFVEQPGFPLILAALELELPYRPNTIMFVLSKLEKHTAAWSRMGKSERDRIHRCIELLRSFQPDKSLSAMVSVLGDPFEADRQIDGTPSFPLYAMTCIMLLSGYKRMLALGFNHLLYFVRVMSFPTPAMFFHGFLPHPSPCSMA